MTTNRDFDRLTSNWLAAGPTELNDRVLDAALAEVHLTHQRRRMTVPWRTSTLSTPLRLAAAIAIVAIVGLAALKLLPQSGVGAPTPAPTSSPILSPATSASPTAESANRTLPRAGGALAAGAYRAGAPFLLPNLTFEVPTGWKEHSGFDARVVSLVIPSATDADANAAFVNFAVPDAVYADPCKTGTTIPVRDLGPTADDFVAALSKLPKFTVGPVTDVVVDSLPGKAFDLTAPSTGCASPNGLIQVWSNGDGAGGATLAGLLQHVIVVDVDGTRLVIEVLYSDPSSPFQSDIGAIISSVKFE